ncbi:holo-ACP synthase [Gorillibacterium sp. sgz500922]|uniref:holo-ACP synthase n=1 Tax=Gorillibacterium sp. sgz500922 TaxID=3446694 RepID=UPI003F673DFA
MILGIGIDLVSLEYIRGAVEKTGEAFLNQIYSPEEQRLYRRLNRHGFDFLGGRFAAKEAFLKAIGTGLNGELSFSQIEFRQLASGQPYLALAGPVQAYVGPDSRVHVSITHHEGYAAAMVIVEALPPAADKET